MILSQDQMLDFVDALLFGSDHVRRVPEPPMTFTVKTLANTVKISHCYHECPYFKLEGGPSPVMYCGHPALNQANQEAVFIISHPDCDTGFPKKCPLRTEQ